jgi:hypothetical protein
MTAPTTVPDATAGRKVNVALVQIRPPKPDTKAAQVAHMRDIVRTAVEQGKERGTPVDMVVLGVSLSVLDGADCLQEMWNVQPVRLDDRCLMSRLVTYDGVVGKDVQNCYL